MSAASYAAREKAKNYRFHWTKLRSAVAHHEAFSRPNGAKGNRRHLKSLKLAHKYREFFADPKNMAAIHEIKFEWGIELCPRLVRDSVLGSAAQRQGDAK